jgi:hypothetical protein
MGFIPERGNDAIPSEDARRPAASLERDSVTDDLLEDARDSLHEALSMLASSRRSLQTLASERRARENANVDSKKKPPLLPVNRLTLALDTSDRPCLPDELGQKRPL